MRNKAAMGQGTIRTASDGNGSPQKISPRESEDLRELSAASDESEDLPDATRGTYPRLRFVVKARVGRKGANCVDFDTVAPMSARIECVQADITREAVDAIVNAANTSLLGGGGVDGAIHRAGGPAILAECRLLGGCATGQAKATTAGNLPARYVIHTVGPVWHGGTHDEAELLAACHRNALAVADELGCRTVAFPAISTGIFGYPLDDAALVAVAAVAEARTRVELVRFCLFGDDALEAFERALSNVRSYP
jgi:O-acetyl-ADP-ribose deacetylase